MKNLTGKWLGTYTHILGDGDNAHEAVENFEITIKDDNGNLSGVGYDTSLENEEFSIKGFFDDGLLSFIKTYNRLVYQDEEGNIFGEDEAESSEIVYNGNFDLLEQAFLGTWEIRLSEEQVGYQDEYDLEFMGGEFTLRREGATANKP